MINYLTVTRSIITTRVLNVIIHVVIIKTMLKNTNTLTNISYYDKNIWHNLVVTETQFKNYDSTFEGFLKYQQYNKVQMLKLNKRLAETDSYIWVKLYLMDKDFRMYASTPEGINHYINTFLVRIGNQIWLLNKRLK